MDVYGNSRTKYDIPLNHLDFGYVSSCNDIKELEKIIKILRSGEEGSYPDLEKCAEERLISLDPLNKILRKSEKLKTPHDIDKEEWKLIDEDLQSWVQDVKVADQKMSRCADGIDTLPPVRSTSTNIGVDKTKESASVKSQKRVKPREYREWDKFDIEGELEKVEEEKAKNVNQSQKPKVSETIESAGLNDELKLMKAEREKSKGNESFRSGDYDEALVYYSRSLALCETVAARNNRAQTYLKLKKWNQALDDCEAVIKAEPDNLKAILRRAVANEGLTRYVQAKADLEVVLAKEPNNKQALEVMKKIEKAVGDQKTSGRRMVIEEVDGSDSEDTEAKINQINTQKSASSSVDTSNKGTASNGLPSVNSAASEPSKEEAVRFTETAMCSGDGGAKKSEPEAPPKSSAAAGGDVIVHSPSVESLQSVEPLPPAVQALKDDGNDLFRKGQYGEALEKYGAAIQILSAAGRDVVNLSTLYSNRAACLMKVGDCMGCVIDCDSSLALCPGSTKALLRRAMAYEALEKYRQAYVDFRQVLLTDMNAEMALQGSDRCANMLQRLDGPSWRDKLPKVLSSSNLMGLASSPPSPPQLSSEAQSAVNEKTFETCKAKGNESFSKGNFQTAIELFTKCIELFPDRVVPYTNRALCYLRLSKYDVVLSDCNQALSLEFHNVKALFRRAQAYKMLERYEESMIDLETLLKIDPSNAAAKKELQVVRKLKEEEHEKRLQASLRKHRQRVPIEEVDSSSDEEQSGKKPAAGDVKPDNRSANKSQSSVSGSSQNVRTPRPPAATVVPKLNKVTAFEFTQAWGSLKGTSEVEPYVKILDQIQPKDLSKVISNKLDCDVLITVVRCVSHLIDRGESQRGFEFLVRLSLLPRFDAIALFLSETEKKEVTEVFKQLTGADRDTSIDSERLALVQKKFGL